MKRIFIFAASVLSVIGCTLTTPKSPEVTAYNLQVYSSLELGKCVAMPSVLTSVMAEFDEYLKKSKEEMLMDEVFNKMEGDNAAARENTWLYSITAYRLISPPMELPATKVS